MDTLTIEVQNPKARELLQNLADMGLINILPPKANCTERWKKLSDSLPNVPAISEQDILDEIEEVRLSQHPTV